MGLTVFLPAYGAAQATGNSTGSLPTTAPPPPPLNWQPCADEPTKDCATLVVPLDYANLAKGTTSLPVVRARATDTANKIGVLAFFPGGPGFTSTSRIKFGLSNLFSPEIIARFDIVGFDARGTSTGVACFTSEQQGQYWEANHLPRTTAELNHILGLERQAGENCVKNSGALGQHLNTASTVRDTEQLRRALGVPTLNIVGQSQGSYVATRYATLYKGKVRAMLLDAAVDRTVNDTQIFLESNKAYDEAWKQFKNWCQTSTTCSMRGQNVDAVFDQLLAQARQNPIPAPRNPFGDRPANDWILTVMIQALTAPGLQGFEWVDTMIDEARRGDASLARLVYDSSTGYNGDGTYTTGVDAHRAITCVDHKWSQLLRTPTDVRNLVTAAKNNGPRFAEANVFQGPAQCYGYPLAPVEAPPVAVSLASSQPPVLVVGGTKDATTPYLWSSRLASKIPGSRLLTRNGDGHVSYNRSACVQQHADNYLIKLSLPPAGTVCPSEPVSPETPPDLGPIGAVTSAQQNIDQAQLQAGLTLMRKNQ